MPEITRKVIPVTTGDLIEMMKRFPKQTPVWIGQCEACSAGILAIQGPGTLCQTCGSNAEVRPLTKKVKENANRQ